MSTIIECPACSTRYKMNKPIPEGGRSVKCARCGHQWRLVAEEPEELTESFDAAGEVSGPADDEHQHAALAQAPHRHQSAVAAEEQAAPSWEVRRGNLAAAIASIAPTAGEGEESEAQSAPESRAGQPPSWSRRGQSTGFQDNANARNKAWEAPAAEAAEPDDAAQSMASRLADVVAQREASRLTDDAAQSDASPAADAPAWQNNAWLRGGMTKDAEPEPQQDVDPELSVREALRAAIEDHGATPAPTGRDEFGARGSASALERPVFAESASENVSEESQQTAGESIAERTYEQASFAEVAERAAREAGEADARSFFAQGADDAAAEEAERIAREAGKADAQEYFEAHKDELAGALDEAQTPAAVALSQNVRSPDAEKARLKRSGKPDDESSEPGDDAESFEDDIAGVFRQPAQTKRSFGFGAKKRTRGGFTDYDMESDSASEQADERYMADSPLDADSAALQAALEGSLRNRHSEEERTGGGLALAAAWAVFISVLSGVTLAFVSFRDEIVVALPGTAALYRMAGFDVQDRQVDFGPVTYRWTEAEGKPMIEVTGQIINLTDREISVPRVLVQVHDKENTDTVKATATVRSEPLAARETADFTLEFLSPPRSISQIELAFSETQSE